MNGDRYEKLIGAKFAEWREQCFPDGLPVQFVQDHEHCLRQDRSIAALSKAGCPVVQTFPKHSPDLNAIEGQWRQLRERLDETAPVEIETRPGFLCRLRRDVNWLNEHRREHALQMCTNQKERDKDMEDLLGAKTKW
jgi:hypothetical protein